MSSAVQSSPGLLLRINRDRLDYHLAVGLILVFPLNLPIVSAIRVLDLYVLIAAAIRISTGWRPERRNGLWVLSLALLLTLVLGYAYGSLFRPIINPGARLFIIKFPMIFALFWIVSSSQLSRDDLRRLTKLWIVVYLGMVAWVYVYLGLRFAGVIIGSFRPSFPMSNLGGVSVHESDAHLYSAYLSAVGTALYFSYRERVLSVRRFYFLILGAFSAGGLVLTGSRNGIVTVIATVVLYESVRVLSLLLRRRRSRLRLQLLISSVFVVLLIVAAVAFVPALRATVNTVQEQFGALLSRAFNFNLGADTSTQNRLYKQLLALQLAIDGPILIGLGIHTTPNTWYDGSIGTILINTGFTGLFLFVAMPLMFIFDARRAATTGAGRSLALVLVLFVLNHALASLVGEYMLTTRGAAYVAISMVLLRKHILAPPDGDPERE